VFFLENSKKRIISLINCMECIPKKTSFFNPIWGVVACLLALGLIIALVCYAVVTNNEINQINARINNPDVDPTITVVPPPSNSCLAGSVSVCSSGTSVVGQLPIFGNTQANLVSPSSVVVDGTNNGDVNLNTLKFRDATQTNFLGLISPSILGASTTWTLPNTDGTAGQLLQTNGSGTLAFSGNLIDTATHIVDVATSTKRLDFNMSGGTGGTGTTIQTIQTANRNFILPNVDGLAVVERQTPADGRVIIGANNVNLRGRAKVQNTAFENSDVAPSALYSLAQYRCNQFGDSAAAPGLGCFKSRSAITDVGANMGAVKLDDHILDITASGVTSGLASLGEPISGWISIQVSSVPVGAPGFGWIGTDYQLELVSKNGGQNGKRPVFRVSSEGIPQLRESISPAGNSVGQPVAGLATLPGIAINTVTVANTTLPANARILLTVQPGTAPAGQIYVSLMTPNTSFDITSTNPADTCTVYYQIWQPITQL